MPIVSLLKEWSDIEPDRCSHVGDMFAIRGWTLTLESDIADRLVNAEIQCAVQEAIESHGWHWVVGRIAIEKGIYYKGRISIQPVADQEEQGAQSEQEEQTATPRLNTYLSTHSPTHVLLQAYVHALKVMAKVNPGDKEAVHDEIIAQPAPATDIPETSSSGTDAETGADTDNATAPQLTTEQQDALEAEAQEAAQEAEQHETLLMEPEEKELAVASS